MPKKTRPDSEEARLKRDTEDIMNRVMLLGMRYFKLQLNRKIEFTGYVLDSCRHNG
jgi:hypothetical protein